MNDLELCLKVVQGLVNHCGVNSSKTTWAIETSNLVCSFVWRMPSGHKNNFPKSGRCFRWVHSCRPEDFRGREG